MSVKAERTNTIRRTQPQFQSQYAWDGDKLYTITLAKLDGCEQLALQETDAYALGAFVFRAGEIFNWIPPLHGLWPELHIQADEYRKKQKYRSLSANERAILRAKSKRYDKKDDEELLTNVERTILLAGYMRDTLLEYLTAA